MSRHLHVALTFFMEMNSVFFGIIIIVVVSVSQTVIP